MEAHPIPQNVTAFEFKLVGNMTLKQFLYLSAGVGTAYLIFVFLLSTLGFLAWPLIAIFALLGIAFAFMPIADRPLDYWVKAFLRAIYSPTQLVWSKNNHSYQQEALFPQRGTIISQVIVSLEATQTPTLPKITPPTPVTHGEQASLTAVSPTTAQPIPPATPIKPAAPTPPSPAPVLPTPSARVEPIKTVTANKFTTPPKSNQPVLTTAPNVINGIITDSVGNYLEGVVVVIYDKSGLPVRALKTNKLGQFSGSTPLPNGTYLIELEKESLVFDKIQINLKGAVLSPMIVAAKKLI